jgi:O-antigen ligase
MSGALAWDARARPASARIPFYLLLLGFPLWWALGSWAFMWPILAFPLLLALLMRRSVRVPPYFSLWLFFLAWVAISSTALDGRNAALGFGFRAALYVSASILLLYVLNTPRGVLPTRTIANAITAYFLALVLGGWIAVLVPDLGWTSIVETLLPESLTSVQFVYDLVHPSFAQPSKFLGYELGRPHPLFAYANEWGSTLALLAPVAVLARESSTSPAWRRVILAALVAAAVPFALSLDRGAWLSLIVGAAFITWRLLASGRLRTFGRVIVLSLALAGVLFVTGAAGVISDRLAHPHSDEGRAALYLETVDRAMERPLLGHGAPRPSDQHPGLPSVGTHGQWFLVLFSQGAPGLVLLVAWLILTFFALRRDDTHLSLCVRTCLLIAFVQGFYYELLPMQLHFVALLVALAWRERSAPPAPALSRSPSIAPRIGDARAT